jgi:hypothetical protein
MMVVGTEKELTGRYTMEQLKIHEFVFRKASSDTTYPEAEPDRKRFDYGIRYMCVEMQIDYAEDMTYRLEWTVNGKHEKTRDLTGLITSPSFLIYQIISNVERGSIIPLESGTYQVDLFLNDTKRERATAWVNEPATSERPHGAYIPKG